MACYSPAPLQGASCFLVPFPGGCARKAALPPANVRGSSGAGFSLSYSYQADPEKPLASPTWRIRVEQGVALA